MKKALVFVALLILMLQANAYILTLRKPGDTVRMVTDGRIDADSIQQMINDSLQLNRAGCYPLLTGKCKTYIDFPITYATLRVYAGIEKVLVWETIDYKGVQWLNFRAYGYASRNKPSYNNYSYYNTSQSISRFAYISARKDSWRGRLYTRVNYYRTSYYRPTYYRTTSRSIPSVSSGTYYNAYSYRHYLIR